MTLLLDEVKPEEKVERKTFVYRTSLDWLGNRAASEHADGKPNFRIASPPEFHGEPQTWSPEDLFVAAIEACTMTTFISYAQRRKLPIDSYTSTAEGVMTLVDGEYRFSRIVVKPTIFINDIRFAKQTEEAILEAHRHCMIANSVKAEVEVAYDIEIAAIE